jgi:hypothetical protein
VRHRAHRWASAAYGLAIVAGLVWVNRSSGTNLAWIGLVSLGLLVAWTFGHRDPREGTIVSQLLFAAPFGYLCLLLLMVSWIQFRKGGEYTAELVGSCLAGSGAMGTICGVFLVKAIRTARA